MYAIFIQRFFKPLNLSRIDRNDFIQNKNESRVFQDDIYVATSVLPTQPTVDFFFYLTIYIIHVHLFNQFVMIFNEKSYCRWNIQSTTILTFTTIVLNIFFWMQSVCSIIIIFVQWPLLMSSLGVCPTIFNVCISTVKIAIFDALSKHRIISDL